MTDQLWNLLLREQLIHHLPEVCPLPHTHRRTRQEAS